MTRSVFLLFIVAITIVSCKVQTLETEVYSIEKELTFPNTVKILVLNRNFDSLDTIPPEIEQLVGLEELIFIPHYTFKYSGKELTWLHTDVSGSELETPLPQVIPKERALVLPEEIGQLKKLWILDLTRNTVKKLPESISYLSSLEEVYLDETGLDIDFEISKLADLESLRTLSITGCKFSYETIQKIISEKPDINLVTQSEDRESVSQSREVWFEFQMHDTYIVLYKNDKFSERFYNSMPEEYRKQIISNSEE